MKPLRRAVAGLALFALVGCGDGGAPAVESFQPSLVNRDTAPEVDLSGMTTTASGLSYMDLAVGDGNETVHGESVTVHYIGWFLDGEKFDASVDKGVTFDFDLGTGSVIAGWHEGVAGMRVGGIRRLVIPPDLAYGAAGRSGIPPNSTLVFDVELFQVGEG
jgi:FKBP-type peptidyl-prolyl cis-trans isomerase